MKKVILITGGQRSGKSHFAESLALSLTQQPIYLATSRVWDEDYRQRIQSHKAKRDERWHTIEEDKQLSRHHVAGKTVVIDCVSLWVTNYFFDSDDSIDEIYQQLQQEFTDFTEQAAQFIFVTNEIGLGGMSVDPIQRRFTDLLGWMNQYVAQHADEVYFVLSGIPVKIKG